MMTVVHLDHIEYIKPPLRKTFKITNHPALFSFIPLLFKHLNKLMYIIRAGKLDSH